MRKVLKDSLNDAKRLWGELSQNEKSQVVQMLLVPVGAVMLRRKLRKKGAPEWAAYGISVIVARQQMESIERRLYRELDNEKPSVPTMKHSMKMDESGEFVIDPQGRMI